MKINSGLALIVIIGCFVTAWMQGLGWMNIPEFVQGVLYATGFTLVIQFFFRKKEGEK